MGRHQIYIDTGCFIKPPTNKPHKGDDATYAEKEECL